jgi:hypothetical protein
MKRDTKKTGTQKILKLSLTRETLRSLNNEQLVAAVGAGSANGLSCATASCAYTACCTGKSQ